MGRHTMSVAYSVAQLAPADVDPIVDPSQPAELTQVTDSGRGLIILTGIAMGPIVISIEHAEKTDQPGPQWQERDVVTMKIDQPLFLSSPTMDDPADVQDLYEPVFTPTMAGPHTVTVLARGRDLDRDGIREDPCEEYLVLIASCHH